VSTLLLRRQQKRTYAAAGGVWQPADLGAQLKAWWNASDLADGAVTTWTDRVASLSPTQATAGFRPVRSATSFNSAYAGVTFDGTDDRLSIASIGSLPTGTTGGDIYALISQDEVGTVTGVKNILSYGSNAVNLSRRLRRNPASSINRLSATDAGVNLQDTLVNFSGYHIASARWDSAAMFLYLDGTATTPATVASSFNTATTSIFTTIGAHVTATSEYWKGLIRHIFVTTTLVTADRQKLEGWMAWDVALASLLPAGHPYKAAPP